MLAKRRSSIAGMGTPLADVGLAGTVDRRISVGQLGRSPLAEISENVLIDAYDARRHTIAAGAVDKGSEDNVFKRASLSAVESDREVTFNLPSKGRLPAPRRLSSFGTQQAWEMDEENDENSNNQSNIMQQQLAAPRRSSARYSLMGGLDTYAEESDLSGESSLNASRSSTSASVVPAPMALAMPHVAAKVSSYKTAAAAMQVRRSSILSLLSNNDEPLEAEDTNDPRNRLSIEEVLRSFRDDPTATENAIAMVSATGRLLPSDFRKFVKAFKSPSFKANRTKSKDADAEAVKGSVGVGMRAWQTAKGRDASPSPTAPAPARDHGHTASARSPNARLMSMFGRESEARSSNEHVVQSYNVTRATRNTHHHRSLAPAEENTYMDELEHSTVSMSTATAMKTVTTGPWTQQELRRASDALRRASFSTSNLDLEPLSPPAAVPTASPQKANMIPVSPLAQLQAELDSLRTAMASQTAKFDSALLEKDQQAKELAQKLQSFQRETLSEIRSGMQFRSAAQAVEQLRSLEETRLAYEMDLARRNINRLGSCKFRILERREARSQRLEDIDEAEESMSVHVRRRDSGHYESTRYHAEPQYAAIALPSPGRNKFMGLPAPRNPDMFAGSAFIKPQATRLQPPHHFTSSNSAGHGHYAPTADYDDYDAGGNNDFGAYETVAAPHQHRAKMPKVKKAIAQKREPKPVFKASPSTRWGLNFVALDEGAAVAGAGDISELSQDSAELDMEYRREKRLEAALKREEARRQRGLLIGKAEEEEDSEEDDVEDNEDYQNRRLKTFKTATEKRKVGRPRGTFKASKASALRPTGSKLYISKAKVPGRGRGRPPKALAARSQIAQESEEPETAAAFAPPKKKVGRPKGTTKHAVDSMIFVSNKTIRKQRETKAEKELAQLYAGNIILSAREVKKLENKVKKSKIAFATAAAGIPKKIRPLSSYAVFCKDNRAAVLEANPEQMRPQDVLKLLAGKWRECTAEEKVHWQIKADEENATNETEEAVPGISAALDAEGSDAEEEEKEEERVQLTVQEVLEKRLMEEAAPAPEKKKRGRPPKIQTDKATKAAKVPKTKKITMEIDTATASEVGADGVIMEVVATIPALLKKRGRPKKFVPESLEVVASEVGEDGIAVEVAASVPVLQKKRGRPKKIIAESEETEVATKKRKYNKKEKTAVDSEVEMNTESLVSHVEMNATIPIAVSISQVEAEEVVVVVAQEEVETEEEEDVAAVEKSAFEPSFYSAYGADEDIGEPVAREISSEAAMEVEQTTEEDEAIAPKKGKKKDKKGKKGKAGKAIVVPLADATNTKMPIHQNLDRRSGVGTIGPIGTRIENQHTYFSSNENSLNISNISNISA